MCRNFVHLHNHTEYSLLDGSARIPKMVGRAKEMGMDALAISDHGVMFGVMEFALECEKQGIRPIVGMEAYVAPQGIHIRATSEEKSSYHLLLLAKNLEGYRNLCKLHTVAALRGFYRRPRIDHDLLREHAKGLVGTTTCLGSEVNQALLRGDYERAKEIAAMYRDMFDPDSYFVELQDHGLAEQRKCNEGLLRIARELKLPLIATNDTHYLCKGDDDAHDVLLCIGTGSLVASENRFKFDSKEFYLKTAEEMAGLFPDFPEALENTARVADMCRVELGKNRAPMPRPEMPEGATPSSFLRDLAQNGLAERITKLDDEAQERLNYELGIIEKTGFDSYFLLVREFTNYARKQGIAMGVRGSAAGSLVSYCIGITDVNPLEYDLTFERFLNPERISMPDVDLDFEDARRDEMIRYVTERFGQEHVAQIVTFGTMGAKAALRDCGRVLGFAPMEVDQLCKMIPNQPVGITLSKALDGVAELRETVEAHPELQRLVNYAKSVEGLARHPGVHAAGIVISAEPLDSYIPLYRGSDNQAITAYEMGILEKIGLLKMDFLGLSNLTVLSRAVANIRETFRDKLDDPKTLKKHPILGPKGVLGLPLDDAKTFELLSRGDTVGVFQLESGGMQRNIIELKPQSVKELAAMVALYRPGPMDHIPRFVSNKFGRTTIEYLDERMRPILEETYGIIVYQDQVLKLVQALAGFTLGRADNLRRAMGKKDRKTMDSMHGEFMAGCAANGIDADKAQQVWTLLEPFAGYAFNKAHAVCYALIAYQTAYLKANYPVEYMAALLAAYRAKEDKVVTCIEECRKLRIPVLPPNVNRSFVDFTIEPGDKGRSVIRFGLGAIKGVGDGLVNAILKDRAEGPYTHLYEFAERIRPHGLNRGSLEALVKSGALGDINPNRRTLLDHVDSALTFADHAGRDRAAGQVSLFGEAPEMGPTYPPIPESPMPGRSELLTLEKEVLGLYLSDHPLRGYEMAISLSATHSCASVAELQESETVKLAGVIAGVQNRVTKAKGEKMANIVLEDLSGQVEATVFPATYRKYGALVEKDKVVSIRGAVSHRGRNGDSKVEIRVEEILPMSPDQMSLTWGDDSVGGSILVRIMAATRRQIDGLRQIIEENPGDHEVVLQVGETTTEPIVLLRRVAARAELVNEIRRIIDRCEVQVVDRAGDRG